MQLVLENPDFDFILRGADGHSATVNTTTFTRSFIVTPTQLRAEWDATDCSTLTLAQLQPLLDLSPEIILLGCGAQMRFPGAEVQAACLSQHIGLEVMTNAAAARTFNVLAAEARQVVAGFIFPANT